MNLPATGSSAARIWNGAVLYAIGNDFARPPIHARNLFHTSAAMYDAWAAYADEETPYLLGRQRGDFQCTFNDFPWSGDADTLRAESIAFAIFRLVNHRFVFARGIEAIEDNLDALMAQHGYDPMFTSTDYSNGSAAALGNYIASCYIGFGFQDGSNELLLYENQYYEEFNPPLDPHEPGNPNIIDLNRWQSLDLEVFIDQAGNVMEGAPPHMAAEWGNVLPFAMTDQDMTVYERDGHQYRVYLDPGLPPAIDGPLSEEFKWSFSLVSIWQSHLDPTNGVMVDISPASMGNAPIELYPRTWEEHRDFYNLYEGGTVTFGHDVNPATGASYEPQIVPLGDYARVLAEFWADGPDSYTPPGHWYQIMNDAVSEHPDLIRRFGGAGPELSQLEWDVKAYLTLGGAMHDAAIAAWSAKGWYDYVRPISAIRAMADRGQSSDPFGPSYHVDGIPLHGGFIEVVEAGDPLAGDSNEHVGKIKLYTWRGPDFVEDPAVDFAGVGWILAENWWPYQLPTFVTPPFSGYVSGHSTYSAAAAETLTRMTGSQFFPGGLAEFEIAAGSAELLEFEFGPSVDIVLQWATYRDASDQTSLSRIWGGIHPPIDDVPGRLMGIEVGQRAFEKALTLFSGL